MRSRAASTRRRSSSSSGTWWRSRRPSVACCDVREVATLCERLAAGVLSPGLLIAQVGDVLERHDQARIAAVEGMIRRRAEHVVVVPPADEHRQLDA
jgi:hypothetical protein